MHVSRMDYLYVIETSPHNQPDYVNISYTDVSTDVTIIDVVRTIQVHS